MNDSVSIPVLTNSFANNLYIPRYGIDLGNFWRWINRFWIIFSAMFVSKKMILCYWHPRMVSFANELLRKMIQTLTNDSYWEIWLQILFKFLFMFGFYSKCLKTNILSSRSRTIHFVEFCTNESNRKFIWSSRVIHFETHISKICPPSRIEYWAPPLLGQKFVKVMNFLGKFSFRIKKNVFLAGKISCESKIFNFLSPQYHKLTSFLVNFVIFE